MCATPSASIDDLAVGAQVLDEGVERLLRVDAPHHLADAGGGLDGRRQRRVVDALEDEPLLDLRRQDDAIGGLLGEIEPEVDEEAGALIEVFDAVDHGLDAFDGHCRQAFQRWVATGRSSLRGSWRRRESPGGRVWLRGLHAGPRGCARGFR